jgi:hypothetical protein
VACRGHLLDTPFPWQEGSASFAGRRDTFFNGWNGKPPLVLTGKIVILVDDGWRRQPMT